VINRKIVILAVLLSLLTAASVYLYLNNLKKELDDTVYKTVFVAAVDIPKNTIIKREMLRQAEIPQEYAHPRAITEAREAVGKISTAQIYSGQQVLADTLVEAGERNKGLAYAVPKGRRAVSVAVNEVSGISGLIMPGDRVDVIATLDIKEGQSDITQTSFILQDIRVLAVGKKLDAEAENWINREELEKTVTLAVTPKEAQPLVLASERGSIRLLLRSPVDHGKANLTEMRLSDFINRR